MGTMLRVAFSVFKTYWRVVLLMVFFFAVAVFALLLLSGYRDSAMQVFQTLDEAYLVVHEKDTIGEFHGSRISPDIGQKLLAAGCSKAVPAIHGATGTAGRNYQFVLGVDLGHYKQVQSYQLLAGRELQTGEDPQNAMIGRIVAERDGLGVGDQVELRGRYFDVVGIFETRAFADNQVWITLPAAQTLLGWGEDVSYFLVPDEGILQAGQDFEGNTYVSQRGESMASATREYLNVLQHFSNLVFITGLGTALAFGNLIFRLASIQKYELAILRTLGFRRRLITLNFIFQAGFIFLCGFLLALVAALVFPHLYELNVFDLVIQPDLSLENIIIIFITLASMAALSIAIPLVWFYTSNISSLLRTE